MICPAGGNRSILGGVRLGLALALALVAPASAATTWYAGPADDTSKDCTSVAQACEIHKAVGLAAAGDDVVVLPGSYGLSSTLTITKPITLEGSPGQARPQLLGFAGIGGPTVELHRDGTSGPAGFTLRHLEIASDASGVQAVFSHEDGAPATIEDVIATASGANAQAIATTCSGILVRSSVARTTGSGGTAIRLRTSSDVSSCAGAVDVRNVTADARGTGSVGISATVNAISGYCNSMIASVKNTIARGTAYDTQAQGDSCIGGAFQSAINTFYSDWVTKQEGTGGTVDPGAGHVTQDPLFVDAAGGDYHELAGSPTIDAGTAADTKLGATDFDGDTRTVGAAPDIGADEYVPPTPAPPSDGGPPPPGGGSPAPDTTPPVISGASVRPARFTLGRRTTFLFTLSEPAGVAFTVERVHAGRIVAGKCVSRTARNRRHARCHRYTRFGRFGRLLPAGAQVTTFNGRLGTHRLTAGTWRVTIVATDAANNHSARTRLTFVVVRPRRHSRV
jgi:hypothetical protein